MHVNTTQNNLEESASQQTAIKASLGTQGCVPIATTTLKDTEEQKELDTLNLTCGGSVSETKEQEEAGHSSGFCSASRTSEPPQTSRER